MLREYIEIISGILGIIVIICSFFLWLLKKYNDKKFIYNVSKEGILNKETKKIKDYLSNPKMERDKNGYYKGVYKKNEDGLSEAVYVSGLESFQFMLEKNILTRADKYKIYKGTNYGTEHNLFTCDTKEEFKRQAENLYAHLIDYYNEWIQRIYTIKRKNGNIIVEYKVNGIPETIIQEIKPVIYKNEKQD